MIEHLKTGDSIRQSWISRLVTQVNANTKAIKAFNQMQNGDPGAGQQLMHNVVAGGSMPTSLTWVESSRSSTDVTLTDSNSDTATLSIATQVVMTASSGGVSYSWTFQFATS